MIGLFQWGPRPGQPDNCNFADEYDVMDDPAERRRRVQSWLDRRYGRVCCGPIYCPPYTDGRGVQWAPFTDWTKGNIQTFYDRMDELISAGLVLQYFAIPDADRFRRADGGPALDVCERDLGPIYRSAEFQKRFGTGDITIGWEPDWCWKDWVAAAKWVRSCFPDANIRVHMQPGHSAPGWSSELTPTFTEGDMWNLIAPYVNGCDWQSAKFMDAYPHLDTPDSSGVTPRQSFIYDLWDLGRRFKHGYAGWPTTGYRGQPMTLRAFEFASYWVSRALAPESVAVELGNQALTFPAFRHAGTGDWVDVRGMVEMVGDGRTVAA